jgi:hypothetical protein
MTQKTLFFSAWAYDGRPRQMQLFATAAGLGYCNGEPARRACFGPQTETGRHLDLTRPFNPKAWSVRLVFVRPTRDKRSLHERQLVRDVRSFAIVTQLE